METALVILIVIAAGVYVGRVFFRGFRQKGDCACGCTCCSLADACTDATADPPRERSADRRKPN